jgi:hypothetical protein
MPKELRYQKDIQWIKDSIRYLEGLNACYESVLKHCSVARMQLEDVKKRIEQSSPELTVVSCLVTGTGISTLVENNVGSEETLLLLLTDQQKPQELSEVMNKIQERISHAYGKYCLNV